MSFGRVRVPFVAYPSSSVLKQDNANLPVSLASVKDHLKIDNTDSDSKLNAIISAVSDYFEQYTNTILLNKTYTDFHDRLLFSQLVELYRSRVSTINSIKYLSNDVLTTFSNSNYKLLSSSNIFKVCLKAETCWPTADNECHAWEIDYVAGFGATDSDIPDDIKEALLHHVASIFVNRGDCSGSDSRSNGESCNKSLPDFARIVYNSYKIRRIRVF